MDIDVQPIAAAQIDLSDLTFQITTTVDKTDLALSISAIGLLQPPILAITGHGFAVVCGFRRIRGLMALHHTTIPARILPRTCSPLDCARMAIADNSSQRALNMIEQARAYALIHRFVEPIESWRETARSVGLPDSDGAKNRMMQVATMPDSLQAAILEGHIALPVALALNECDPDVRDSLVDFLGPLDASLNIQRELMEMILEISCRDLIPVSRVIRLPDMASIMDDAQAPMPQKVRKLRQVLKGHRYPTISCAEKQYQTAIRALHVDPRIQVQPPRDFEGKTYHLTLAIHSSQELDALWPDVRKIASAISRADWLS